LSKITATEVKELRDITGAGFMDCKKALEEADGNQESAINILNEKGLASAAKKANRSTSEGLIVSYIHTGGRVGAMVELNCETDFVARTEDFESLGKNIAMQVAAMDPKYLDQYYKIVNELRENNINSEIYLDATKNLKKQLTYADKKGSSLAIICGQEEIEQDKITIKKLKSKKENDQISISSNNLINEIKKLI